MGLRLMKDAALYSSYDTVEYDSYPFQQAHPDRLATIGVLLGMNPADANGCRVLELGCSSGGNLIPMADQLPGASFVGVDASSKAIDKGLQTVAALGLRNIELRHANILHLDESLGKFDYIITHGVFSWVPTAVQDKMLWLLANLLNENGVGYISYNTYPGWHFRGMIRDVMVYHARFFDSPDTQVHESRALVDFLAKTVPVQENPYGLLLSNELKLLQEKPAYYLYHDFLEEHNSPAYFYQFANRARQAGLQYLGEADFSSMSASNFSPQVERALHEFCSVRNSNASSLSDVRAENADDLEGKGRADFQHTIGNERSELRGAKESTQEEDQVVRMEQYMDFVRNRMFRQTLLCRKGVRLDRDMNPDRIYDLYVASNARPADKCDVHSREPTVFQRPGSTLTTSEPLVKAAMLHLAEIWPRSVQFRDLVNSARRRLNPKPLVLDAERVQRECETIARPLLRCYATTHVELSVRAPSVEIEPSSSPQATRLARHQAIASNQITNLWHQSVSVSDLQRHLLQRLDGAHDREALVDFLVEQVNIGKLVVHEQGTAVNDSDRVRELLGQILETNLKQLGSRGLLMSSTP